MFFVYIIQHSEDKDLYIGYTSNLKRRLEEHNACKNKSTRRKVGEWQIVYCEIYRSQTDAENREKKLKHHGSAKHELYKRIANSLLPKTGAGSVA
jgi:putative endonuclease